MAIRLQCDGCEQIKPDETRWVTVNLPVDGRAEPRNLRELMTGVSRGYTYKELIFCSVGCAETYLYFTRVNAEVEAGERAN